MNGVAFAVRGVKDRGWRPARCAALRVLDTTNRFGFKRAMGAQAPQASETKTTETTSQMTNLNHPAGCLDNGVHLSLNAWLGCRLRMNHLKGMVPERRGGQGRTA